MRKTTKHGNCRVKLFLERDANKKLSKLLNNACERFHFSIKLQDVCQQFYER